MKKNIFLVFLALVAFSCGNGSSSDDSDGNDTTALSQESMSFRKINEDESGINFYNSIKEDEDFNFYNYEYIYNGGGVAVGDINNDGLTDIYFVGNQVADKLYLNQGDMRFKDITSSAFDNKANEGWHTGVVMVDINADGWLDIYVSRSGNPEDKTLLQNMLFVNNQDNTFTERAEEYGLNIQKRTTQAAFFDFDNDGDLDCYVLNHPHKVPGERFVSVSEFKRLKRQGEDADVFLENRDGKFYDISVQAGIENNCFGLGIAVGDLDGNGFSDVYVSNDYQDVDFMYMNNGDGTFSHETNSRTGHISNFSMGNDMADFNNDGFIDIMTVDMAAEDHVRSKRNMGGMSTQNFWDLVYVGFHYQYMFNGLQLNNGDGTFTEMAQLAGVSKTDWSWAPLFADFDNDGMKDLFITNGYRREARDNDYTITYAQKSEKGEIEDFQDGLNLMPTTKIFNYIFKNEGDLKFSKKIDEWGFDEPVNSGAAAFADFDNDGDLDLVVNNMEEVSFILENELESQNNYVRFKVEGSDANLLAIGARVKIKTENGIQFQEIQVTRGYESSVESIVHFGIGKSKVIEELEIEWPNGQVLLKKNIEPNQLYSFSVKDANSTKQQPAPIKTLLTDISDSIFMYRNTEDMLNDFESEVLMPNKMSQLGPFIAEGDVDGDGLADLYVSGPADYAGKLFIQKKGVGFIEKSGPWIKQIKHEELGSLFFDADGDGDLDLYVISGGNEYNYNSPFMQDQLYINDGQGNFSNETLNLLPKMETSGQRLAAGDYDQDGDLDLFVPGRQTPGYYPFAPRSYMLQNDGNGKFTDVTAMLVDPQPKDKALNFMGPGMVTDALFDDVDQDGDLDLVMVGEWMKITFFENREGKFIDVTDRYNPNGDVGWWYSISKGDFNGDGKNDYIAGNLGANNKFHPTKEKPLEIYCHDFDENGTYDIVLAKYQDNICYPVRGRQCSSEQMPFIQNKFPTYSDYASADIQSIYGQDALAKALHFSATDFHSVILLTKGNNFETKELPVYAQLGPINKSINIDVNGDGFLDVIAAGNNFAAEVETIRYDGGRGVVLLGNGKGGFQQLAPLASGFKESNDCKDMVLVNFNGQKVIITVSNNAKSKTFLINQ